MRWRKRRAVSVVAFTAFVLIVFIATPVPPPPDQVIASWRWMRWRKRRAVSVVAFTAFVLIVFIATPVPPPPDQEPRMGRTYPEERIEPGCACRDNSTGRDYNFCYRLPGGTKVGKRFSCSSLPSLLRLDLLERSGYVELDLDPLPRPVIVTGSSDSHFSEQLRLIEKAQKYQPDASIVLYDLGLKEENVKTARNLCQTTYRKFRFQDYPKEVKNLGQYRWKPIIIAETLREFGAIWWMDSSVVLKKSDLSHVYALALCRNKSAIPQLLRRANSDLRSVMVHHHACHPDQGE